VESGGRDRGTRFCLTVPLGSQSDLTVPDEDLRGREPPTAAGDLEAVRGVLSSAGRGDAMRPLARGRRRRRARYQQPH
jgi:hypothetical protein